MSLLQTFGQLTSGLYFHPFISRVAFGTFKLAYNSIPFKMSHAFSDKQRYKAFENAA